MVVEHGAVRTTYEPVSPGTDVARGQLLGWSVLAARTDARIAAQTTHRDPALLVVGYRPVLKTLR